MTLPPLPESAILAPISPSLQPTPDDWPDFNLHHARAFRPEDPDTLISLFVAHENYPVKVIGDVQLSDIEPAHAHLIREKGKRTAIIELEVRTFAYGQYDDGEGTIAIWAAGQAGWYTLKPSRGYREIFRAMEEGVRMLYAVADVYKTPRKGKRKEEPWTAEECFEKVGQRYEIDAEMARARVEGSADFLFASMVAGKEGLEWVPRNPVFVYLRERFLEVYEEVLRRQAGPAKGRKGRSVRAASSEVSSTTSSLKRKRGRQARDQADVVSLASSATTARSSAKPSKASQASQPKSTSSRRTRHSEPTQPRESMPVTTPAPPTYEASDSDSSSSPGPGTAARKGKSALRLKPAAKGKAPARPSLPKEQDDSEDEMAGRSSPTGREREREPKRRSPTQRNLNIMDESIDIPSNSPPSPPASNPDVTAGAEDVDPHDFKHDPDPVQEDTWTCALAGCNHKVYFASRADSQKLIKEHYILHAYDDDERVQLVKRLKHSSLPVSHLMEKVRLQARAEGLGEEKKGGVWGNLTGSRFAVVQQRY